MFRSFLTAAMLTVTVSAATAATPPGSERTGDILPFKATETTLENGLKVIVVPTGFPNIVSIQIPVQTGSRNEVEPGKSGFAHFFEHMMFRGTADYPPEVYQQILTKAGARQNAYTTDDYTNYHTTFAKEDLATILKIEADRFQNLSYSPEAFKTEARAVLGEYNKNAANPIRKILEAQRNRAFTTHTYKHTTMGFIHDIEDMPNQFEYSKTFFDRWYRPENTTIIIAGDVDPARAVSLVKKYWGGWKRGSFKADIPAEPPPAGPLYEHVDWPTDTLPYVTVGFRGPAFSDTASDFAASDLLVNLYFGPTSDLYKKLVEQEQKVDQFFAFNGANVDPSLITFFARVKDPKDAVYVRDEILKTAERARREMVADTRLADAKSNARYSFARGLDNTEAIASTLAEFVHFDRSYDTLNKVYRVYQSLTPADLQSSARKYFTDKGLIVTTLSRGPLPNAMAALPSLASFTPGSGSSDGKEVPFIVQKSELPLIDLKLLFSAGSALDPKGKEGLAALSAAMIADAGSAAMPIDEIRQKLYPMAGSFDAQVDKEMTTFTGVVNRDNWKSFSEIVLPMLLEPGFRESDFKRVKDGQLNTLKQNLRLNNEEELGKERLQTNIFAGTPYGHPVLGTVEGIESITLDDVRQFVRTAYGRGDLMVGLAGDVSDAMVAQVRALLAKLPAGSAAGAHPIEGKMPSGIEVEIIKKDARGTFISFGHPIPITRKDSDFPALLVARTWLGEHRSSMSHLYNRIREIRGMNYGDYAYIEAFPRGMYQFFPDPNIARRAQIFEIWIRPVVPANGHMALKIAIYELEQLIEAGLSQEDFEATRDYLMKNVFLMTATQDQQIGYALDSRWYGIGEYTSYMRDRLTKLTRDDVNRAIRQYLSADNLSIVIITKDAEELRDKLVSDAAASITYDAPKPQEIVDEDKRIGAMKLNIRPADVKITPVEEVFKR